MREKCFAQWVAGGSMATASTLAVPVSHIHESLAAYHGCVIASRFVGGRHTQIWCVVVLLVSASHKYLVTCHPISGMLGIDLVC